MKAPSMHSPACVWAVHTWQVVVDVGASHLVHSASEDCMLLSYNVKTGRRYNIHTVRLP